MGIKPTLSDDATSSALSLMAGNSDVLLMQGMQIYPTLQTMLHGPHQDIFGPKVKGAQMRLLQPMPLWMVTSLKTPASEAEKLTAALENFKRTPAYQAIVKKYQARQMAAKALLR
jgi:hypothetical protein